MRTGLCSARFPILSRTTGSRAGTSDGRTGRWKLARGKAAVRVEGPCGFGAAIRKDRVPADVDDWGLGNLMILVVWNVFLVLSVSIELLKEYTWCPENVCGRVY